MSHTVILTTVVRISANNPAISLATVSIPGFSSEVAANTAGEKLVHAELSKEMNHTHVHRWYVVVAMDAHGAVEEVKPCLHR